MDRSPQPPHPHHFAVAEQDDSQSYPYPYGLLGILPAIRPQITGSSSFAVPMLGQPTMSESSNDTASPRTPEFDMQLPEQFVNGPLEPSGIEMHFRDLSLRAAGGSCQRLQKEPRTKLPLRAYASRGLIRAGDPIAFNVSGMPGIALLDALRKKHVIIDDGDEPMFLENNTTITLRIEWPNYVRFSKPIKTQHVRKNTVPISRSDLATKIAEFVDQFISKSASLELAGCDVDPQWKVGEGFIETSRLVLVGLKQVSKGSFEPILELQARG